jgi:hypothetical protein
MNEMEKFEEIRKFVKGLRSSEEIYYCYGFLKTYHGLGDEE